MAVATSVSVLIFTLDEEENLSSCLDSLEWSDDVVVVDSGSTDGTLEICKNRKIRVYQHRFQGFGLQRNWALENIELKYPWVLILDADEKVTPELANEISVKTSHADPEVHAYRIKRKFFLWGKWLKRSSLYPTWVVRLVKIGKVRYVDRGHAESQIVDGNVVSLEHEIVDENRKGIDAWFARQNAYSRKEAEYEMAQQQQPLRLSGLYSGDPIIRRSTLKRLARSLPARSVSYFLYSYIWRRGFLDGKEGLVYCAMRAIYQEMIAIKKYDIARKRKY